MTGTRDPSDNPARFLTTALGLNTVGLDVVGAKVFGRGPSARVDVFLSEGLPLRFERYADVAKPAALAAHLVTQFGVRRTFKGPAAAEIAAAVFRLAEHHAQDEVDETAIELGMEYLRIAPTIDVFMADQGERWEAFAQLARMNPARDAGDDRSAWALAAASTVLVDANGDRYVRTGWFAGYVKREVGRLYSPSGLVAQMEAVGWHHPNTQGRIKATAPNHHRTLGLKFYVVPGRWELRKGEGVTASSSPEARVRRRTHAKISSNPREPAAKPLQNQGAVTGPRKQGGRK